MLEYQCGKKKSEIKNQGYKKTLGQLYLKSVAKEDVGSTFQRSFILHVGLFTPVWALPNTESF